MSVSDITIGTKVYSLLSVQGTEVVRNCTSATLPANLRSESLIVGHQAGKGNKADRHVVKFSREVILASNGTIVPLSLHLVLTVPKGMSRGEIETQLADTTDGIGSEMSDILASGSGNFLVRLANSEYS